MAIQAQPSRIPEPFAGSGTKNTIPATNTAPSASQAASWASGFPPECSQPISSGGCPVPRNDVNGALNQLSQDYAFRQDGGVWEWSASADYDASRIVRGSDGKIYVSSVQSGPGMGGAHNPVAADGAQYWQAMPMDDANVVHKTGDEIVAGAKTFLNNVTLRKPTSGFTVFNVNLPDVSAGSYPTAGTVAGYKGGFLITDQNAGWLFGNVMYAASSLAEYNLISNLNGVDLSVNFRSFYENNPPSFHPNPDNAIQLGVSFRRWSEVFATTSAINTSDERLKSSIASIPDEVLDAWENVGFVQYQFADAVGKKGNSARLHAGLIAQRIDAAFAAAGLDASRYGLFCHDQWDEEEERRDESGRVVQHGVPAGDLYSLRYEEALCMEAACQRRRADRAEARLAELEERLAAIEAKLNS